MSVDTSTWVQDACKIFDDHAGELGWTRHIYSDQLRALVAERDTLRAQLTTARAEALEEAAQYVDHLSVGHANHIRALITPPKETDQ